MKKFLSLCLVGMLMLVQPIFVYAADSISFNDSSFGLTWNRVDKAIQEVAGVGRGYTWGPVAPGTSNITTEQYNGTLRKVQYFDKARMEVNNPQGNPQDLYFVTTGLLVKELVTGDRQDGDNAFTNLTSSTVQIAGDSNEGTANSISPTYASFKNVGTFAGTENSAPKGPGKLLNTRIDKTGKTSVFSPPEQQVSGGYDEVTRHNIAQVFDQFSNQIGLIWDGSRFVQGSIFFNNATYVLGRPLTEAYWIRAVVAGTERDVLVQLFERRVLTYTPTNPAGFKVEMGNVGQHYYRWRYILNGNSGAPPTNLPANLFPADSSQFRSAYHKSGPKPVGGLNNTTIYNTGATGIYSSPAVSPDQSTVVFGTDDEGVVALNAGNLGALTPKWTYPSSGTPAPFKGTPLLYNGVVYIGANDGRMYAINLADGKARWDQPNTSAPIAAQILGAPITDGVNLYFTAGKSNEGRLYAIRLSDGAKVWQSKLVGFTYSGPVFGFGGNIFFSTSSGEVYGFTAAGEEVAGWNTPKFEGGIYASPAYANGVMYVASLRGNLYSLNSRGAITGSTSLARAIYTMPAVTGNRVYIGTNDGLASQVIGVAADNVAKTVFSFDVGSVIDSSIAVVDGYVYFGANNGNFYQISANSPTNNNVMFKSAKAFNNNSPVVASGKVFIGNPDGNFYLVK